MSLTFQPKNLRGYKRIFSSLYLLTLLLIGKEKTNPKEEVEGEKK